MSSASYALELWATAELREGQVERAGWRYALAEHGYRQVGARIWAGWTRRGHRELETELRTTLGNRYEQLLAEAQTGDLDQMVDELIESEPAGAVR
jgi:hypothetical protein